MSECQGERLVIERTGNPEEVLEWVAGTDQITTPGKGEVRVRMLAAPINPADLNFIEGTYGVKAEPPTTPGLEGVGEVEESGDPGFAVGDRVILMRNAHSWAQRRIVSVADVVRVAKDIDLHQAAMMKVNPATAFRLLADFVEPKEGEWVIQNAGNSGVSRCLAGLARARGVKVISFVRRIQLADELREGGAELVVADDDEGLKQALEAMGGANAVLACNSVGGESAHRQMKLLAAGGTHTTYGAMSRKPLTVGAGPLIFNDIRVRGLWVSRWIEVAPREELERTYEMLGEALKAGTISQPVDSTFPLAEFRNALERLNAADRNGKVLFSMGE